MSVITILLQKTVRSIQLHLNELFGALGTDQTVSASAWSQARAKLRHTAFIDLNQTIVLKEAYSRTGDFPVRDWRGHRLLAIDSSVLQLPNEKPLGERFGWVECHNQNGPQGANVQARLSILYDVLNHLALQTLLEPWKLGERQLPARHMACIEPADLTIMDRGFASYEMLALFVARKRAVLIRCPASSFAPCNGLFAQNQEGQSLLATLRADPSKEKELKAAQLPTEIRVRFVTVRLKSGELEVLVTTLCDEQKYPTQAFGELYFKRWGIETYYGLLKGRLDLENFSGYSPQAIEQDVHATVLLSNIESILTAPSQAVLEQKKQAKGLQQKVNRAVSFHAIKTQAFELLFSECPIEEVLERLEKLFLTTPVLIRPERQNPRQPPSSWRSNRFRRTRRKSVY